MSQKDRNKPRRQPHRRRFAFADEITAPRMDRLADYQLDDAINDLKSYYHPIVDQGIPGTLEATNAAYIWRWTFKRLLPEFLSPADLTAFLSKHNPAGKLVEEMTPAERGRLFQAALTRLLPLVTVPAEEEEEEQDERQSEEKGAPQDTGESVPPSTQKPATQGPQSQPSGVPEEDGESSPETSPGPASDTVQDEAEEKKPLKWDDLSPEDQERLRQDILGGNIAPGGDEDATPIDVSTFPEDLQEAFAQQVGQQLQQAMQAFASKVRRWLKQRKSAEEATGIHDHNPGEGPSPDQLAQELADAIERGEFDEEGQEGEGQEGKEAQEGEEGEEDHDPFDDFDEDTPHREDETNDDEGYGRSAEMMQEAHGTGSGGRLHDLKLEPSTFEDRIFSTVQEQFLRLAGDPDPSARRPEGQDVHNVRKLVKATWNPGQYPLAYQDLERAPEDIYFILDTSGSVSSYAATIAAMAAGSLGLVHLYHGSEAHPQHKVLRNAPLRSPKEFLGFGETNSDQDSPTIEGRHERQVDICAPAVPGYSAWRRTEDGQGFEGNLEWWLMREKPPTGSRIIFWGDTQGVSFYNPTRLVRLLRPYKAIWLFPESLDVGWNWVYEWWGRRGGKESVEAAMLNDPASHNHYEYMKLQLVGIPVIGNCQDTEGLRMALRKVR